MINLSSKGRYATRIMIHLARQSGSVRKGEIAAAEELTVDYVEQILIRLKAAGLITSRRGANGGFSLARPADQITVADVLAATEGSADLAPCLSGDCPRIAQCATRPLWEQVSRTIKDAFTAATIAGLAAGPGPGPQNFEI